MSDTDKPEDWRQILADEDDPDDEEMSETPPDVVAVLGFDPAKEPDRSPTDALDEMLAKEFRTRGFEVTP